MRCNVVVDGFDVDDNGFKNVKEAGDYHVSYARLASAYSDYGQFKDVSTLHTHYPFIYFYNMIAEAVVQLNNY